MKRYRVAFEIAAESLEGAALLAREIVTPDRAHLTGVNTKWVHLTVYPAAGEQQEPGGEDSRMRWSFAVEAAGREVSVWYDATDARGCVQIYDKGGEPQVTSVRLEPDVVAALVRTLSSWPTDLMDKAGVARGHVTAFSPSRHRP